MINEMKSPIGVSFQSIGRWAGVDVEQKDSRRCLSDYYFGDKTREGVSEND